MGVRREARERSDEAKAMRIAHSNGSRDQNTQVWDMTQTRKKIKVREKKAELRKERKNRKEKKKKEKTEKKRKEKTNQVNTINNA